MPNIPSVSPHYLNDPTSFKETLDKLTEAKSLSVNSQGNLAPTSLFNNAFKIGTISNPRLVELKIMEFLIHGKKWLKPQDLQLLDKLAGKVGLAMEKNNQTHKELHLLINLIAKEVLQKEVIPQKDYQDLCQAFQTHYRYILASFPNHCEQVNAFADSLQLQDENNHNTMEEFSEDNQSSNGHKHDTEQHEQHDAVTIVAAPVNDQRNNTILPKPISKRIRTVPSRGLHSKNLNSYEQIKRLTSQIALGTMGTIATGSALYHSSKFLNSIHFSYLNSDLPKITPQVSYIGAGIVGLGISTMILGTAYFYNAEKNRNHVDQKNNQEPITPLKITDPDQAEPEREKIKHLNNEEPINLDFMYSDHHVNYISPTPNSYKTEIVKSIDRRNDATKALREKTISIKQQNKANSLKNNSSPSPMNKNKLMKNAVIYTPTKDGKLKKEDLLESINKIREDYIQRHDQSSFTGDGILEFVENIQQIVAGSLPILNSPTRTSSKARETYKYAVSSLKKLVKLLNSHHKKLSEKTNIKETPLQKSTAYLDFFDYESHTNTKINNLRLLMDYLSLMASLDPFKNATKKNVKEKYLDAKNELIKLMKTLPPLEPAVVKSQLEKFTMDELCTLNILHTRHTNKDILETQDDTEQTFILDAWAIVFDQYEDIGEYIEERIEVLEHLSEVASQYDFDADHMDAIYEEFKNFTFDKMETDSMPTLDFEKNTDSIFDNDNEASCNEELSSEEYLNDEDIISECFENTQFQITYNGCNVTFRGDIFIAYK